MPRPRAGDLREIQVWGRICIKQRRRRRPRARSRIALRASKCLELSRAERRTLLKERRTYILEKSRGAKGGLHTLVNHLPLDELGGT